MQGFSDRLLGADAHDATSPPRRLDLNEGSLYIRREKGGVMNRNRRRVFVRAALVGCLGVVMVMGPACGEADAPSDTASGPMPRWTRVRLVGSYSFEGDVFEDKDLSGIACVSRQHCLIGADEGRRVQVARLSREAKTLRVERTIELLTSGEEIDIEAIAADGGYCYIVGSHGISKKEGRRQENRFKIFRLKVDPAGGVAAEPDVASLSGLLRADPVLGPHYRQPLQRRGVNIEGLAAREGRLFVGFRGPNLDGNAFVMEIAAEEVFAATRRPGYRLRRVRLGKGLGIRELVALKSGFLIIAGNAGSEPSEKYADAEDYEKDRGFEMFAWDGQSSEARRIGVIPNVPGKAEAMTVLEESEDDVTVLMLFDGPKRGRPSVYRID